MFDDTPNALAPLALALWPLVALALVARLGASMGAVATLLGGYLLLPPAPAGLDLPLLPALTKDSVPSLAALVAVLWLSPARPRLLPEDPWTRALIAVCLVAPWATVLSNPDPVAWGAFGLPGLHLSEAVGTMMAQVIMLLPWLLGRALLASDADLRGLLRALAWGGVAYAAPMLLEVRLAPQVNAWVYGFFQHLFEQMVRGDGYRPIVFLTHGLWAALLAVTALAAALALWREAMAQGRTRAAMGWAAAAGLLALVLVLCKSMASLLYGLALAPLLLLAPLRLQLGLAAALAVMPLAYPVAKATGLAPQEALVALAERVDAERAFSLEFRFGNEDALLARAGERPLFGWGLWGRNLIYERDTGRLLTIPDGRWIILLGSWGWVGMVAVLGLLTLPVLRAWGHRGAATPAVAALALILAVNLVDLIPNATETPLTWLIAGGLMGWAERQRRGAPAAEAAAVGPLPNPALGPALAPAFQTVLR